MPPSNPNPLYYYWDSCVFLALIKQEAGRVETIRALLKDVTITKGSIIYTASVSIVEVAFGVDKDEQNPNRRSRMTPQMKADIDNLWVHPSVVPIDAPRPVMYQARELMRKGYEQGWVLRTVDAIQLATAVHVHTHIHNLPAFHTYDLKRLKKYSDLIGIPIEEPYTSQLHLGI